MRWPVPDPVTDGQESVWSYPRPAIAEPCRAHLVVQLGGRVIAETRRSVRTIETSHPPTYYFPWADVDPTALRAAGGGSFCEWKGSAAYFDILVGNQCRSRAAWTYPDPTLSFATIRGHVAFYAGAVDACFVDGERVEPQPGGFYGGWITAKVAGPFKGVPGSTGW